MAFGATAVITVNAVAKTLNRINQDSYGSEYYLREPTLEYRMRIRNTLENPRKTDQIRMNRHNVEITQTIFATSTTPLIERQAYFVFRNQEGDTLVDPGYLIAGAVDYVDNPTVQSDLLNWMS